MSSFFDVFKGINIAPEMLEVIEKLNIEQINKVTNGGFIRIRTTSKENIPEEAIIYAQNAVSRQVLKGMIRVEIENQVETTINAQEAMPQTGQSEPVLQQTQVRKSDPASQQTPARKSESVPQQTMAKQPEQVKKQAAEKPADNPPEAFYGDGADTYYDNMGYEYVSMEDISGVAPSPSSYSPGGGGGSNKSSYSGGGKKYNRKKKETDPDMIYGKSFEGTPTALSDIIAEMRDAIVDGEICDSELTITKNGYKILKVDLTDYHDSISMKLFLGEGEEDLQDKLPNGMHVRVHGKIEYDNFEGEIMFTRVEGIKKVDAPIFDRQDNAPVKRVELHLHTRFSDMDAMTNESKLLKRAAAWGHHAIAITDHGVVQAFPPAFHALEDVHKSYKKKEKPCDLRIIYGVEGYLVDDDDNPVLKDPNGDIEPIRMNADGVYVYPSKEMEEAIAQVKKKKYYHIILLAANEIGRINLYKLVSFSHINYFNRRPRIPRSVLNRYRQGIIVGSACVAGELMDGILAGVSEERLEYMSKYYDYLEIQPTGNNEFLIRNYENNSAKGHKVKDIEGLRDLNRKVVELGERYGKPVCATGDVHFLDPQDEVFRRIILDAQKFPDADEQPPLYYRTTEEMLEEFAYLGEEKAYEVVVTNTNLIADMTEYIEPVRPDKCPPVIENSEQRLTDMVYENARKMYGENLPPIVTARIERELNSIIGNGYAVLYIIAMELVTESVRNGYLVGSRGSVGSSFVATMASITEVNPLSPHYRCDNCFYSDFDSPEVKAFAGGAGCDMPDKACPVCGKQLIKDGFDIPFETFMGFKGDKEPDIDLNFSGEYQAKAHAYTETLFGAGHTFRAGTIAALQDKTVYGYVKNYVAHHTKNYRKCEINRIIRGCVDVKRSTGQHPGGIVVLPHGEEIYSFTPIQFPSNDSTKGIITTHFEYHSIDHNLLKLDELGHDDPTMIRMLEDITGFSAKNVKLDDPSVMALFDNIEILGVKPEDVDGYDLGTLGIPEFGTDFVMGMLKDTKPKNYSDLVRIAGLSHGTDVWLNNAQELVKTGQATLSTCICTRDDIMTYLMLMNLEPSMAFDIMENVRKGKVAGGKVADKWENWKKAMKEHDVPDWYLWSCERIQYMFPKAHAVAYVMMAYRIAYYKIFYPLAYYATYFSIRASAFNYELMCQGKEYLLEQMALVKKRIATGESTPKDDGTLKDMKSVLEMYARGFEFLPIDIYRAKATRFQVIDGKIMPSFTSLDGMGEKAAESLEAAAAEDRFTSREDMKIRGKVSSTMVDKMYNLGLLGTLPESSQISFADLFKSGF